MPGGQPPRLLALLTALGAAVFLAGINAHPVGRDEAVSLLLVGHPLGQIIPSSRPTRSIRRATSCSSGPGPTAA